MSILFVWIRCLFYKYWKNNRSLEIYSKRRYGTEHKLPNARLKSNPFYKEYFFAVKALNHRLHMPTISTWYDFFLLIFMIYDDTAINTKRFVLAEKE